MLAAAVLVPDTALLVPGAAGAARVLADERDAAVAAVTALVGAVDRVVVVAPGPGPVAARREGDGPAWARGDVAVGAWLPSLTAAAIDDAVLGWAATATTPPAGSPDGAGVTTVTDVPAAVGLHLLARAGQRRPVGLLRAGGTDAGALTAAGARAVAGDDAVGLLLVGSLSARHGLAGPLPHDERAPGVDDEVVADLLALTPAARDRLRAMPADLATTLAISAWRPWLVLLGALPGDGWHGTAHTVSDPDGARYAVLSWTGATAPGAG